MKDRPEDRGSRSQASRSMATDRTATAPGGQVSDAPYLSVPAPKAWQPARNAVRYCTCRVNRIDTFLRQAEHRSQAVCCGGMERPARRMVRGASVRAARTKRRSRWRDSTESQRSRAKAAGVGQ